MINFLLGEEKQGPVVTAIVRGAEKYREELDRQKMELDWWRHHYVEITMRLKDLGTHMYMTREEVK